MPWIPSASVGAAGAAPDGDRCKVRRSASLTNPTGAVTWDETVENVGDLVTVGSDRLTFSRVAVVLVSFTISYASGGSRFAAARLFDSTGTVKATPTRTQSTAIQDASGANQVTVAEGDYLVLYASGGDIAASSAINETSLAVVELLDDAGADDVSYDNSTSGLAATTVQDAIDEVDGDLDAHLADTDDAHDATAISNTPSGNLEATTVQAALDELQSDVDGRAKYPLGFPYNVHPLLTQSNGTQDVVAADRALFYRVLEPGTISKIAIQVHTSSGNICVGVYANSGSGRSSQPGTRKATSGAVACPSAGHAEVSLGGSVGVEAGDWFAISADNTTAKFRGPDNDAGGAGSSYDIARGSAMYQVSAHPLPATASPSAAGMVGRTVTMVGVA